MELPVIVHEGAQPGPTAVITANLHGDECTGIGVCRQLDALLLRAPPVGRVVMYPSCNPPGLAALTRHVPADEVDLNRTFPGSGRGTLAGRMAASLWQDVASRRPDLVIDLHADAPNALPYAIVDRPVRHVGSARDDLSRRICTLAEGSGLTVLREYPDEVYVQFGLDRSLAGAVVNLLGCPAITLEVGPRRQLDPQAVEVAFRATLGVLSVLGVVSEPGFVHPGRVEGRWRRASSPRARRAGLLSPSLEPGERFARGDVLARIVSLTGEVLEEVRAVEPGVLVSWVEQPWVPIGGVLGTLGIADRDRL